MLPFTYGTRSLRCPFQDARLSTPCPERLDKNAWQRQSAAKLWAKGRATVSAQCFGLVRLIQTCHEDFPNLSNFDHSCSSVWLIVSASVPRRILQLDNDKTISWIQLLWGQTEGFSGEQKQMTLDSRTTPAAKLQWEIRLFQNNFWIFKSGSKTGDWD